MKKFLFIMFFVAFAVFLGCVNKYFNLKTLKEKLGFKEGFATLNPANYKCADVLLDGFYPVNVKDPVTSRETYSSQSRLYPVLPAHSLETNNIEYWKQPENGTDSFPELSGVFYTK
jgi:hypothetical protein